MVEYLLRHKNILKLIVIGLIISPLFGVIGTDLVGYHEPLDVAAEALHLKELEFNWTPLRDYTVPGLPDTIGYVIAGAIGVTAILLVGYVLIRTARE